MPLKEFTFFLAKLSPLLLAIGIITGLFLYKKLNAVHKSIVYYFAIMLCVDLYSRYLAMYGNNQIVLLIYSLVELIGVTYFYNKFLLVKKHIITLIISLVAITYIGWELFSYLFLDSDVKNFQPYAKVADNFVVILLALTFLYEKMNSYKESKWDNFRLNIVVLVYFTLNTLIFLPFNFLVNEGSGIKFYFWGFNIVITLLFYVYLINEIWKNGRIRK